MAISEATLRFLTENMLQDSRTWFAEHKERYKALVEEPLLALSARIGPAMLEIDPLITVDPKRTLSRIWRDTRFTKDKTVYREVMWLIFRRGKGMEYPSFFFEFSPAAFRYGIGYYHTPPGVMDVLRKRVLSEDKRYLAAQKAVDDLPGFHVDGDRYKRSRYPDASPTQREWLERKGIAVLHNGSDPALLFSGTLHETLCEAFRGLAPVYRFLLDAHIQCTQ